MAKRRIIIIPEGLVCKDCGGDNLRGRGTVWRVNPHGSKPPRIKVQMYMCKDCGFIFVDDRYKKEARLE